MAFTVREFYHNTTFTVPAGVTQLFYEFIEEFDLPCTFMAATTGTEAAAFYIQSNGMMFSIGSNGAGQLGNNSTAARSLPLYNSNPYTYASRMFVPRKSLTTTVANSVFLVNRPDYSLYAWGLGTSGATGLGVTANSLTPVFVNGIPNPSQTAGVHAISTSNGFHTAAITRDGRLYTWGANGSGQLGDNTTISKSTPVLVVGGKSWLKATVANGKTIAIDTDGKLFAWGTNTPDVGIGARSSPVQVLPSSRFIDVKNYDDGSAIEITTALDTNHKIWSWGQAVYTGAGTLTTVNTPVSVNVPKPVSKFELLSNSSYPYCSTICLTQDGEVYGWGENVMGEVGDGSGSIRTLPTPAAGNHRFSILRARETTVCAVKPDGTLWYWGKDPYANVPVVSPTQLVPAAPIPFIDAYTNGHSIWALAQDGTIYAYGQNPNGYFGQNTTNPISPLTQLAQLRTNLAQGGSGAIRHAYGGDILHMAGVLEVLSGQTITLNLGARPTINGMEVCAPAMLNPTGSGFPNHVMFARLVKIGWVV